MAFRIVQNPRAWWKVSFPGVAEDGSIVSNEIEIRYLIHTEDEYVQLQAEATMLPEKSRQAWEAGDEATRATMASGIYADFIQKIAIDWRGVEAENGDPMKWSPEALRHLVNVPNAAGAIVAAYSACRRAAPEIRAGN